VIAPDMTPPAIAAARRWFAEDLRVSCHLTSPAIVDAFATVPRERFLGPGPWTMRGLSEGGAYSPAGDDPVLVYHNVAIAIDPSRDLYNGQPGLIARWLEDLAIPKGARVVHIGSGTGYFTAILGQLVGPSGRVWAVDVDASLAERARANVAEWPWIEVTHGDGRAGLPPEADVVLVHAGATHVLDEWLDALVDGGRLLVPLTGAMPAMGATLGKGMMLRVTRKGEDWAARVWSMVAIYSLVGARDDAMNVALGRAMMTGTLMKATRLRRDSHEAEATCVLHGSCCLSE
jgi:protein-L-isoaspartate(D-aspartate) O-methyltransferase